MRSHISRREFAGTLALASAAALNGCVSRPVSADGILDTHTHFYDPTRPQGVPWPPKDDPVLHRPVYPAEFLKLARPHGVTGTVVVEASPWLEDNHWVLKNDILNAEIGLETDLTDKMSLRTFLQDTYDNVPAPGRKKNDLKLVTAIAYKF